MKMKNRFELKRTILYIILVIIIGNITVGIVTYNQYKTYTSNFNNKIAMIIEKVQKNNPNISKNEIIEILNSENLKSTFPFNDYGIDVNSDSILLENDKFFNHAITTNLIIFTSVTIVISLIFLVYNHFKNKKLDEITSYIEEINNKNYDLKIEENTEDELSILKNEIYKTTVTLNEVAENSRRDKLELKEALQNISHQLKTPLTSISIMLDNILDNPEIDVETRNEFIGDIKREIININFLVNSLLKLSKLEVNSVNFINKDEYIETIINESIKNIETLGDLKNVEIVVKGNSKIKINCDLKWQVEAITNILKNAIEHSEEDSEIHISYEQNKMYSKIEIRDFGVGIPEKDLKHIFERFYKCENSAKDSVGIGLALSKAIVESNNGYISVDTKLNEGTTFTIKYFNNMS